MQQEYFCDLIKSVVNNDLKWIPTNPQLIPKPSSRCNSANDNSNISIKSKKSKKSDKSKEKSNSQDNNVKDNNSNKPKSKDKITSQEYNSKDKSNSQDNNVKDNNSSNSNKSMEKSKDKSISQDNVNKLRDRNMDIEIDIQGNPNIAASPVSPLTPQRNNKKVFNPEVDNPEMWLTQRNRFFINYASLFRSIPGDIFVQYSKEDMCDIIGNKAIGIAIYNELHKNLEDTVKLDDLSNSSFGSPSSLTQSGNLPLSSTPTKMTTPKDAGDEVENCMSSEEESFTKNPPKKKRKLECNHSCYKKKSCGHSCCKKHFT